MNTDTATNESDLVDHGHDDDHGLTFGAAIRVAIFLGAVTFLEVMTYFVDFGAVANPMLLVLMVIKFGVVVAYFMHLRFDNQLFTWLFVSGLILAVAVYVVMLSAFEFFA